MLQLDYITEALNIAELEREHLERDARIFDLQCEKLHIHKLWERKQIERQGADRSRARGLNQTIGMLEAKLG